MSTSASTSDRIEKKIVLRAPRSRVWRALTSAEEFGTWFGVKGLKGTFAPGQQVKGQIANPGYEHLTMEFTVEKVEPEHLLSYRWHPHAVDPKHDYSGEPTTLVEFQLQEIAGGTQLTLVESGFDRIPLERREQAFRSNDGGWAEQMRRIERHVSA
ncbi:MAG TPA: SRPBCC family protein [Myxococcales bacterium]|nr:SRPBCC family protein [Myxococcales bacterium]